MKIHTVDLGKFTLGSIYHKDWNDWEDEIFWVPIGYYNTSTRLTI